MTGYNVDLMLQIKEHVTANPESHDQGTWATRTECGTTHCIAGWAAVLSGHKADWGSGIETEDGILTGFVVGPTYAQAAIEDVARRQLGLDFHEAGVLFYPEGLRGEQANAFALSVLDRMIEAGKNGERL